MAKFDYKKWVTENKRGLLNEQTYQQILVPGTTYRLRGCDEMTGMMSCLPDSFFGGSPVPVGHTFTLGFPPQPGNQGGVKNVYVQEVVAPCQWYVPSPNAPLNPFPVNPPTEAHIAPGPLDSCPNNPNAIISDPVDEDFVCYGCHPTLNQIATTITAFSSADENGVCGTVNFSSPGEDPSIVTFYDDVNHPQLEGCGADPVEEFGPCYGCVDNQITPQTGFTNSSNAGICGTVNGVTFYDDENHPQLEGCGAEGSFGTSGNYTVFDYPSGFDVTQWTASFIDMIINHPNPCNFLTQRITQFNNQLNAGVGPLQANQLMQKIAVCQELYQMVGCGGMNEQISGVKKYKLDPKAAAVIRRMAPKLRGLASKGRGVKKESKKISALKRIIKETLSELQEAPKKCKCKNGVCKTAGGTLCPAHECDNKCKGVEDTVDKKNK